MKTLVQVKLDKALIDVVNDLINQHNADPFNPKISKSSIIRDAFIAYANKKKDSYYDKRKKNQMKNYTATILREKVIYEEAQVTIQVAEDNDIDVEEVIKNAFTTRDAEDWEEYDYEINHDLEVTDIKQQGE